MDGVVRSISHWHRRIARADTVSEDTAAAIRAARSGQIATLILSADAAWSDPGAEAYAAPRAAIPPLLAHRPDDDRVTAAAQALAEPGSALLVGGPALYGELAEVAARVSAQTGCRLIAPFFASRIAQGEGAVAFEEMRYLIDDNTEFLKDITRVFVLARRHRSPFSPIPDGRAPRIQRDLSSKNCVLLIGMWPGPLMHSHRLRVSLAQNRLRV